MSQASGLTSAAVAPGSAHATSVYVARQPIFNRQRQLVAYELLYRSSAANSFSADDGDQATRMIVNTTINLTGFTSLVGDKLAYFNISRPLLLEGLYTLMPPGRTVIELLEDIAPDAEVIAACGALKDAGYALALDDFVFAPEYEPLMALADVIKIDWLQTDTASRRAIVKRHGRPGLQFLAEKVESHDDYHQALQMGYHYFQGYFFSKPMIEQTRVVTGMRPGYMRLLEQLTQPQLDYAQLEQTMKADPSMSVKLLRYLNCPTVGLPERVSSIGHALTLLGERWLRRWGTLVAMTCLGEGKPAELLRLCLVRARFCELMGAELGDGPDQSDLFLLGLFSTMDAVLDRSMAEVLSDLPLVKPIKAALLGDSSPLGKLLHLSEDKAATAHTQALTWADEVLAAAATPKP